MASAVRKHGGAVTFSVALHVALVALFSVGFDFTSSRTPAASQQLAIQATIVDESLVQREMERIQAAEREADERRQREEQAAQDAADTARRAVEEEQRRLDEVRQAREQAEQEEQRREIQLQEQRDREAAAQREREATAEQERLRLAELQREREAEEARQREAEKLRQEEAERQRLAEEQRQREEAERQRREEEARQRRLAEERRLQAEAEAELARVLAIEEERRNARDSGLLAEYIRLIQNRIQQNWSRPPSARPGLECEVNVTQIPSGDVVNVSIGRCNGDEAVIRSIEAAVLRASPLPRPAVQSLFERNLVVTFRPDI